MQKKLLPVIYNNFELKVDVFEKFIKSIIILKIVFKILLELNRTSCIVIKEFN